MMIGFYFLIILEISDLLTSGDEILEYQSFENMVRHHRRNLIRISAGVSATKLFTKSTREHLRKLGILALSLSEGKKYVLTNRAKLILEV